jgi:signal peptidase I
LEKSLLIGDFLFVSKFHYGARTPMTTVAAPMVHDTLPFIKTKSYLYDDTNPESWKNKLQLPFFRFPGFEKIENSDIVVFNWPRDTLFHMYKPADRRYSKPTDKKTNYVKRCVGIPGDSLQIKNGVVFINGKELLLPERAKPQFNFEIKLKEDLSQEFLNQYDIKEFNVPLKIQSKLWDNTVVKQYLVNEGYYLTEIARDSTDIYIIGATDDELKQKMELIYSKRYFQANLTQELSDKLKSDSRVASVNRYFKKGAEDGIFPDFREKARIQKDYSLGFISHTPPGGFPMYRGKGKGDMAISLSEQGLYGSGTIEYSGSKTKSNSFLLLPDKMKAQVERYELPQNAKYPEVYAANAAAEWKPGEDKFTITNGEAPIRMFKMGYSFYGSITQSPAQLKGNGILKWSEANYSSKDMTFGSNKASAQESALQIFAVDSTRIAFRTDHVRGTLDFDKGEIGRAHV